jgi:hypothetical protein
LGASSQTFVSLEANGFYFSEITRFLEQDSCALSVREVRLFFVVLAMTSRLSSQTTWLKAKYNLI